MCAKYVKQLSETPCEGSYDCVDDHTVRVTRGCRASFALRSGKTFICESWDKRDVRELASGSSSSLRIRDESLKCNPFPARLARKSVISKSILAKRCKYYLSTFSFSFLKYLDNVFCSTPSIRPNFK